MPPEGTLPNSIISLPQGGGAPNDTGDKTNQALPSLSLPIGGGAIRGIGEKFATNPVTGTGAMTVPIATSPGRSGLTPQLALTYDSGAGNSAFGLGWSLSLPSITRKTDKGLPQYFDLRDSDVFILSGAEDLVPAYRQDAAGEWLRDDNGNLILHEDVIDGFLVRRYKPRIEGLFARIERWTLINDPIDVRWRTISKDNVLTIYGRDSNSRIVDPTGAGRIFSWLICETRDDKGNGIVYEYKEDDAAGVDLTLPHERNRGLSDDARRKVNRYVKHIYYGNRKPLLDDAGNRPRFLSKAEIDAAISGEGWMFEVVFDYGEHDTTAPLPNDAGPWNYRSDPFSSYRSGFEVRTTRLCRRVLMFHHFPAEPGVLNNCLVRSTDFTHSSDPDSIYTFLTAVTQTGYRRNDAGYDSRSLPSIEFHYTHPILQDTVEEVDPDSLENLPIGVDNNSYQWVDLHGEGVPGIFSEQADSWFYKRNISPISDQAVEFAPLELVATKPNVATIGGQAQFVDLAGDGHPDLVVFDGPAAGVYEHDEAEGWQPFRPFNSRLNRNTRDPNLKFVDLDGDGHADVLITEDDALVWHPSLGEEGFAAARTVPHELDEEEGPRLVFADTTQSIYLADLSGDGLTDLVRIRNGDVCYWPNLGYARFGAKITMNRAPLFDDSDQFDHRRIRLADIDGTGTTDIIYLHRDGVRVYFNRCGNEWSEETRLKVFPRVDDLTSIVPADLRGNGTACLVWSSPLPSEARRSMRYVNLMGKTKPHLLIKVMNNLGAETLVEYAPSTRFYLQDKRDGRSWITRLPFPVHVVERVTTYDYISRSRFVTRYAYHHGYFDGEEREFRGFGMVEQWDTEVYDSAASSDPFPTATNTNSSFSVPPVLTRSWFHTGIYLGRGHVSDFFAGLIDAEDSGEYYREPALDDNQARSRLLDDTVLPGGLTLEEEREACRALRGMMLRQEVYALDGTARESHPYTVVEQNFGLRCEQPRGSNRHGVFFSHQRETVTYHYERNPKDPRIQHSLTLAVDDFGNVLKYVAIGYGRRAEISTLASHDKSKQEQLLITYTESDFTRNDLTNPTEWADAHRTPLPYDSRTYQLTGFELEQGVERFQFDDFAAENFEALTSLPGVPYEKPASHRQKGKRLIEHVRTIYRANDLTAPLPLGVLQSLALLFESYKLALTEGLAQVNYVDSGKLTAGELTGHLEADCGYVHSEGDSNWWIPSGRAFYSDDPNHTAAEELRKARAHFFLARRYRDPFHTSAVSTESFVTFDNYDLLITETRDAAGNRVRVEANDYVVLQPRMISDPNRNRNAVVFDALGLVAGTAVVGKPSPITVEGDSLLNFVTNLSQDEIESLHNDSDPHSRLPALLKDATTRIIYDVDRFQRSRRANAEDPSRWLPPYVATIARETHVSDPLPPHGLKIQISFSYSDGFGREIQKKVQAEPEKINDVPGPRRWVGSGWAIFNNKGKPVQHYEPFFTTTHDFEFDKQIGVSSTLFYDPLGRVVATLHPNHTWEKVVFDPWQQTTYDVNDTLLDSAGATDPKLDPDVKGFFSRLSTGDYLPTWYEQRIALPPNDPERIAAEKAAIHAQTPAIVYLDALGRPFLTSAHNRFSRNNRIVEEKYFTRVELDIEGHQREIRDTIEQARDPPGRIVMRHDYDMLGNRIHQISMEAGERWMLNDVMGKPVYAWNSRGHRFRMEYDPLRRPLRSFVLSSEPNDLNQELLTERLVYGEQHPDAQNRNLRGRLYLHLDQAGSVTNQFYDFKGNLRQLSRRFTNGTQYRETVDWSSVDSDRVALPTGVTALIDLAVLDAALATHLDSEVHTSRTLYDALNRPTQLIAPHSNQPNSTHNIIQPGYNEANLLQTVDVWLDYQDDPLALIDSNMSVSHVGVNNIDYDARGQRVRIDYKNGAGTLYEYDPLTFRLIQLKTTRPAGSTAWTSQLFVDETVVQDLRYTYDAAGNITRIQDAALKRIFHNGEQVDAVCEYNYDAIYRLIEARGREHIGQTRHDFTPANNNHRDYHFAGFADFIAHPNDIQTVRNYTEHYEYDGVGNFTKMRHLAQNGSWTRTYDYEEQSFIEGSKQSNQLTRTTLGNGISHVEEFEYDLHGNTTRMQQFGGGSSAPNMHWDYRDELHQIDLGGGGTAYYVYDSGGQRVRKVIESQNGARRNERIYLGGFEIYREYANTGVTLQRETLHVMDDKQRIALVETRTAGTDPAPAQLIRYQFSNHLGSASLELSEQAQVISYEEYTPYGSSAYQASRSVTETPKRYRYSGKERDEESGFYYYGARYYVPWIGRWSACDRIENQNRYLFVNARPSVAFDIAGLTSNRQLIGVDDESAAAALEADPSLGTVLTLTAKQVGYDLWDMATAGFVSKHDRLFEAREEGKLTDADYWAKTTGEASKSLLVSTVSAATGGTAAAGAATLKGAVVRGAGSGAASGAVGDLLDQSADVLLGNKTKVDLSQTAASAGTGALFGAAGAAAEMKALKKSDGPPPNKELEPARDPSPEPAPDSSPEPAKEPSTKKGSADPSADESLVGSSRAQMRREAEQIIATADKHPLKFLLDDTGHFKSQKGLTRHDILIDRPDIVQMGHIESNKLGGQERLMLQGGWENQLNNITIESHHRGGAVLEQTAVDIGGIAVDLKTATFWEELRWLDPGTVAAAPRIVF